MRYAIVGGGFLGKYILRALLADSSNEVTVIDKIATSVFFSHPMVAQYRNDPRVKYVWQSAGDIVNLLQRQVLEECDGGIIFTIAVADVPYSNTSPTDTYHVNVMETVRFFEALRAISYKGRVIVMSSESVYGHQPEDKLPIDEQVLPRPANLYGRSKLCQETAALGYYDYGIRVTVLRSATMFGPYSRTEQAIPVFAQQILKDEPVTLMGDGKQTRDFISVTDVAEAAIKAVQAPAEKMLEGEIFNVGTGRETPLIGLVNAMKMSLRKPSDEYDKQGIKKANFVPINWIPWRPGEQGLRVVLDTDKVKKALDWEPTQDLRLGLCAMIVWVGSDIIHYDKDDLEILNQILYPDKYPYDPDSPARRAGDTMTLTEDQYKDYKRKQEEKLAIAAQKAKTK